jgi:hypothetical protein
MGTACRITQGASNYDLADDEAYSARSFPLDLMTSIGYNDAIVRMLTQSKILVLKFNLPVTEIIHLDHSIPVYLEQYSDYFFVKKISNYIPEQLCNVELIRLT